MPPDKKPLPPTPAAPPARGPGRPRVWSSAAERRQAHQQRRRERERQVNALLHAVRNAHWEEPALQRLIHDGDDLEVLAALTAYYRRRHWMRPRAPEASEEGAA